MFSLLLSLGCAPLAFSGPDCVPISAVRLPAELAESSGIAFSSRSPGVLWTHNDDGSRLFAIDTLGAVLGSVPVTPRLQDWEDIASARCTRHDHCLYLADTGDNAERRRDGGARIMRVAEPSVSGGGALDGPREVAEASVSAEVFPFRFPEGARDVEAIFVQPDEQIYLVTKGRNDPITVYRYPGPLSPDTVTLVEVQRLTDRAAPLGRQVTGASALFASSVVAIRTYQSLEFYRFQDGRLSPLEDGVVNLRSLREAQGEAVGLGPDGLVALTSEGGPLGGSPSMNLLRCVPE